MSKKTSFVKKMSMVLFAGAALTASTFAGENAKAKSLVDPKYYSELTKKGIFSFFLNQFIKIKLLKLR